MLSIPDINLSASNSLNGNVIHGVNKRCWFDPAARGTQPGGLGSPADRYVADRLGPVQRSLFAPDWDGLWSAAGSALDAGRPQLNGAGRVQLWGAVNIRRFFLPVTRNFPITR